MITVLAFWIVGFLGMMWLGRRRRWKTALLIGLPVLVWLAWILVSYFNAQNMPEHERYEWNIGLVVVGVLLFALAAGYGIGLYLKAVADRKTVNREFQEKS